MIADAGNCYTGTSKVITTKVSTSGDVIFPPSIGQFNDLYDYRTDKPNEQAHAVVSPRAISSPQGVNINDLPCFHGHSHETFMRKTAKQIGVKLEGELAPCSG